MKKTRRRIRELRHKLLRRLSQRQEQRQKGYDLGVVKQTKRIRYLKAMVRKLVSRKVRFEEAHREGVDYGYGWIPPRFLLAEGKDFQCRYLSSDLDKRPTVAQIEECSNEGVDTVLVWQDSAEAPLEGYERGAADAKKAAKQALALGQPIDRPIYFAVDFEVQVTQWPDVRGYFRGVRSVLHERSGGYGGYHTIKYLFDQRLICWGWQTYAWSYDWVNDVRLWEKRSQIKQTLINLPENPLEIHGTGLDYCKSTVIDFGQWRLNSLA